MDDILIQAINDLTALDKEVKDAAGDKATFATALVKNLVAAGYAGDPDDPDYTWIVNILRENEVPAPVVRTAMYTGANGASIDDVLPAMYGVYTLEEIFAAYPGNDAAIAAKRLADLADGPEGEEIVAGYMSYWAGCEKPLGVNDMNVALDLENRTLYLEVTGDKPEINDSNLVDVAKAAGLIAAIDTPVTIAWEDLDNHATNSAKDFVSFKQTNWPKLLNWTKAGSRYEINVTIGENTLTIMLSKAAAE